MSNAKFIIEDFGLHDSLQNVLKTMERAEKSALRKGASVQRKSVKDAVTATGLRVTSKNSNFTDRLIDAIRSSKPSNGSIKTHILGTRKKGSGTYRLRFFESSKKRYQTKVNGKQLKKKRYLGTLSKYNGFFAAGINAAEPEAIKAMDLALEKYIEKAFYG